jgi:putative transposase
LPASLAFFTFSSVPHRTFEIAWLPASPKAWATFSSARQETARLWNDLVSWHAEARRQHALDPSFVFPSEKQWRQRCQRQYPNLHSHSVQETIHEFLEAVKGCLEKRKAGDKDARFPWKLRRYRDVAYTNFGARIRNGFLILPHGLAGDLAIKIPKNATLPPGRLMEARLTYGVVRLVFSDDPPAPPRGSDEAKAARAARTEQAKQPPATPTVGIDLGVNTLLAATDGTKAILVSGRGVKATSGATSAWPRWRRRKPASRRAREGTSGCSDGSTRCWARLPAGSRTPCTRPRTRWPKPSRGPTRWWESRSTRQREGCIEARRSR